MRDARMKGWVRWWKPDVGPAEARRVARSVLRRRLAHGPETVALEARLARMLGVPHVVAASSGTSALSMGLAACGVGPGDEVIVPDLTFVATAQATLMLGATVRAVDCEPGRPLIDPAQVERAIGSSTKAIVAVHLNGMPADMGRLRAVAARHGLALVEDAVQALFSRDARGWLGTRGDVGVFSFGVTKLLCAGTGGFLATRERRIYRRLLELRNHGLVRSRGRAPVSRSIGFNFNFNDLQASLALAQLARLPEKTRAHRRLHGFYREALSGLSCMRLIEADLRVGELPLWIEVLCAERARVIDLLAERNVEAKPFDAPVSSAPYLATGSSFPRSAFYAAHGLILPSGPGQTPADLRRTATALRYAASRVRVDVEAVLPERDLG